METMDIFNVFCGACSVVGLAVSIFTANEVIKISKTFNCNNKDDHSKVTNGGKNNTYNGDYTGRDYINGTRNSSEQK